MKSKKEMNLLQRVGSPTPKFFKVLRDVGLVLAAAGGAILTAPISVPAAVTSIAGYLAVAGGVLSAVSQATVKGE
jgi:uncharacterized membrane protein HdeD (DUF308 family)